MPTIEVLALSPRLPVDDLLDHPEGGVGAAATALAALLPGTTYEHVATSTWSDPHHRTFDQVLVSTFGSTTMLLASPVPRVVVPDGATSFSFSYQTTSMAYGIDVAGPRFQRLVALGPGTFDHADGAPLPFEAPFAQGLEEATAAGTFDDEGFAVAASAWMFGCHPLRPGQDDRVDLGAQPVHTFVPAEVEAAPTEQSAQDARRTSGLRRFFGRR